MHVVNHFESPVPDFLDSTVRTREISADNHTARTPSIEAKSLSEVREDLAKDTFAGSHVMSFNMVL